MSDACIAGKVFARLVGRYPEKDTLLFELASEFIGDPDNDEWRGPVEYRFVRREGGFVELELHTVDPARVKRWDEEAGAYV